MAEVVIRIRSDAFDSGGPLESVPKGKARVTVPGLNNYEIPGTSTHAKGMADNYNLISTITATGYLLESIELINQASSQTRIHLASLINKEVIEILVDGEDQSQAYITQGLVLESVA